MSMIGRTYLERPSRGGTDPLGCQLWPTGEGQTLVLGQQRQTSYPLSTLASGLMLPCS